MNTMIVISGVIELVKLAKELKKNPADLLELVQAQLDKGATVYEISAALKEEYKASKKRLQNAINNAPEG